MLHSLLIEAGEDQIEVDLDAPWFLLAKDEQHRHQMWSNWAQLVAWLGLTAVLVGLLVLFFFTAIEVRAATVCVSSMTVEIGQAPVVNPETCS